MTSTVAGVAEAAVAVLRDAGASAFTVTAEQQWHLLAVPEQDGGYGGTLADLAAVVRAIAAAGLSAPVPELYAGTLGGAEGVALPLGGGRLLVPWGRWCATALVLDGSGTVLALSGLRQAENLAGEPVDELPAPAAALAVPGAGASAPAGERGGGVFVPELARWRVLHTARLAGAIEATARRSAAYAETRVQFGRPIARFQAVSGLVAEAHAQSTLTAAALDQALSDVDDEAAVLGAHAVAARAAGTVARIAHQVHGAIGVTQELGLERLTRRLWAWRDLWQPEFVVEDALAAGVAAHGEEYFWRVDA